MKRLILILLLLISTTIWFGCDKEKQYGTITGTVTDAATGEPIGNANVKLNPRGETTLTGNDGSFQFNDMTEGQYSLSISKIGYVDLDDDYVINLTKGQKIRRDVQLRETRISFKICKEGQEVDFIDFGANTSYTRITISIVNDGTEEISRIKLIHHTDWISFIESHYSVYRDDIAPNDGTTVTINLDRSKLSLGENTTYINISADALSKSLEIRAQGLGMPMVSNPILSNISYNSCDAQATVTNNGGGQIVDKGFEYYVEWNDYRHSTYSLSCGSGETNFYGQIPGDAYYTLEKVRAYASNGIHTGYSGWVYVDVDN
jgi:hypothetical protein